MCKKMFYTIFGFVLGLGLASAYLVPELRAQYDSTSNPFTEEKMSPPVPRSYGNLIAISASNLYFQDRDGNVYIVRQRSDTALDSRVAVIPRA